MIKYELAGLHDADDGQVGAGRHEAGARQGRRRPHLPHQAGVT